MNDQSVTVTDGRQSQATQVRGDDAPAVVPEVLPLPEVLRQVARDSRRDPRQYLDETVVPFGGE